MPLLSAADHSAMLTALGESYSVTLNGAAVENIIGIFDPGGIVAGSYNSEIVTVAPSLIVSSSTANILTRRHIITIAGSRYQLINTPPVNAGGKVSLQLQEVR